jgi:hypothetical protein
MTHTQSSGQTGSGWSRTVAAAFLSLIVGGPVMAAQSLGDVAQREAERRKQATTGRVFTNGDLVRVDESAPPPAPGPAGAAPASPDAPAPKPVAKPTDNPGYEPILVAGREKRDEKYWRENAREFRAHVAKANADVAAQEARLAELAAGPQTASAVREQQVISGGLDGLRRNATSHAQELTRFLARAQREKVSEDWVR